MMIRNDREAFILGVCCGGMIMLLIGFAMVFATIHSFRMDAINAGVGKYEQINPPIGSKMQFRFITNDFVLTNK